MVGKPWYTHRPFLRVHTAIVPAPDTRTQHTPTVDSGRPQVHGWDGDTGILEGSVTARDRDHLGNLSSCRVRNQITRRRLTSSCRVRNQIITLGINGHPAARKVP